MAPNPRQLRIAIVGGGVCGLTCALALQKQNIQAQVFEAAAKFGEIGAGVGFAPNGIRILRDLGVFNEVLAASGEQGAALPSHAFFDGTEGHALVCEYPDDPEDFGIGVHRAVFLDSIVKSLDATNSHHNKRCVKVAQNSNECTVYFEDGTTYTADVVLGADGVKSAVRAAVLGEGAPDPVVYGNTYCYRGLISIEDIRSAGLKTELTKRQVCFVGVDKHIIVFPIKNATFINVVAFVTDRSVPIGSIKRPDDEPWVLPVTQEEMLQEYEEWGSDVQKILRCIKTPSKWMIRVLQPLQSYVRGRVALLGDAAHAMLPHLGAGAGQALEDAYLIAKLLGRPETNLSHIPVLLETYDHIRRPRSQSVCDWSVSAGAFYAGRGEHGPSLEGRCEDLVTQWANRKTVRQHDPALEYGKALDFLARSEP